MKFQFGPGLEITVNHAHTIAVQNCIQDLEGVHSKFPVARIGIAKGKIITKAEENGRLRRTVLL